MNNTTTRSDEVDGAFLIHHNVRQKVPDTRKADDGVCLILLGGLTK